MCNWVCVGHFSPFKILFEWTAVTISKERNFSIFEPSSSNSDQNKSKFMFKSMNDRKYLDQQYFIKTKIQKQRFPWNLWILERNLNLNIVICKCHLIVSNLISILNPESAEEVFKKVVTIYNEMRLSNTPLYHFIFDNFPIKV